MRFILTPHVPAFPPCVSFGAPRNCLGLLLRGGVLDRPAGGGTGAPQTCEEGDMPALIEKVPGFKKHIRVFIVHTLATTFQDSTRENMEQCLDLVSEREGQLPK